MPCPYCRDAMFGLVSRLIRDGDEQMCHPWIDGTDGSKCAPAVLKAATDRLEAMP